MRPVKTKATKKPRTPSPKRRASSPGSNNIATPSKGTPPAKSNATTSSSSFYTARTASYYTAPGDPHGNSSNSNASVTHNTSPRRRLQAWKLALLAASTPISWPRPRFQAPPRRVLRPMTMHPAAALHVPLVVPRRSAGVGAYVEQRRKFTGTAFENLTANARRMHNMRHAARNQIITRAVSRLAKKNKKPCVSTASAGKL